MSEIKKVALKHPEFFNIVDMVTGETHLGGNQEWYRDEFQRHAGCGPVVATNLVSYSLASETGASGPVDKVHFLSLMEELWLYVTPSRQRGLPSTDLFYKGLLAYAQDNGLRVRRCAIIDMHNPASERPCFTTVVNFLEDALERDIPVAYLNLDSGEEKNLDEWHWVTVLSLEREGGQAYIEIMDEGKTKRIDLTIWYNSTVLGGGFVYMR